MNNEKPSLVTNNPWLFAKRKKGNYHEPTRRNGKWLIFIEIDKIDVIWKIIKEATEKGKLGSSSKVSTNYSINDPIILDKKRGRWDEPIIGYQFQEDKKNEEGWWIKYGKGKQSRYDLTRKVICIYTYDWKDEKDVMRIREELRTLGITWKIPYKSDEDSINGKYKHKGHKRISKYYE